jgi:L-alanine-DL-glutamate epimerase-like enolase superfamily enzyme
MITEEMDSMSQNAESYESSLNHVNTYSSPSDLRINDMRISTIIGAPMRCPLIKISTNQGIEGYGEVRDGASKRYALMLKSRILGENPCNVDRLFRRIKQFGHHSRQGGGVCGVELAQDYGVAMAVHMAESPIACMAAVHSVAATENFGAREPLDRDPLVERDRRRPAQSDRSERLYRGARWTRPGHRSA